MLAIKHLVNGGESQTLNCGYGKGYSVLEVVKAANDVSNNLVKFKFAKRRNGDVEKLIDETSKIKKYIKWTPKYNNLKTIIKSSIECEKKLNENL